MAARRVLVIWSHPLFRESLRLLLEGPELETAGVGAEAKSIKDEIAALQPEVVVIEDTGDRTTARRLWLQILETATESPHVMWLSLRDNELRVYRYEQYTLGEARDLLQYIRNT